MCVALVFTERLESDSGWLRNILKNEIALLAGLLC